MLGFGIWRARGSEPFCLSWENLVPLQVGWPVWWSQPGQLYFPGFPMHRTVLLILWPSDRPAQAGSLNHVCWAKPTESRPMGSRFISSNPMRHTYNQSIHYTTEDYNFKKKQREVAKSLFFLYTISSQHKKGWMETKQKNQNIQIKSENF